MCRRLSYLALVAGLCVEADFVFIPESPPNADWPEKMCNRLEQARNPHHIDSFPISFHNSNTAYISYDPCCTMMMLFLMVVCLCLCLRLELKKYMISASRVVVNNKSISQYIVHILRSFRFVRM